MQTIPEYNEQQASNRIQVRINTGAIKTVKQLLAHTNKANLPYSVYCKLYKLMKAKQTSKVSMFLRKQAF